MKTIILSIFSLLVVATATAQSLPSIKIKSTTGIESAFKDLFPATDSTTITIVSFWATWCGPCIKELDAFTENLEDWQKELPIKMIGISTDDSRTSNKVKSFVKGRGWEFPIYMDVNNDLRRALNIPNVPHTMVIRNGKILFQHNGYVPGNEDEMLPKIKAAIAK
jgi:peroxiredoxin